MARAAASFPHHERIVATLNEVAEACREGERCWREAATTVNEPIYRSLAACYAAQRAAFAAEVDGARRALGPGSTPWLGSGVLRMLHRGWRGARYVLTRVGGDAALLDACAQAEETARRVHAHALSQPLPAHVRERVAQNHLNIDEALARIASLKRAL